MTAQQRGWSTGAARDAIEFMGPGLVAGMMFGMFAMIVAIWTSTLWAPPQGIAQAVGIGPNGHDFHGAPFVLGLMGHMMNSVILGALFVMFVRVAKPKLMEAVVSGTMYGLIIWALLYYIVLPDGFHSYAAAGVDSFTSSVPQWAWVIAHIIFGMTLGMLSVVGPLRRGAETGGQRRDVAYG